MRSGSHSGLATVRSAASGQRAVAVALAGWAALALAQIARPETLTLAQCLRETAEHNPLILQKRLALEEAAGSRLVFRSRALPSLTLAGLGGEQGRQTTQNLLVAVTGPNGKPTTENVLSPRPSTLFLIGSEALYQPLFDAAIPASWRRGNIELAVARSNFLVFAVDQLNAARTQFYGTLYQQQYGALLREVGRSLAANLKGQQDLFQAGLRDRQSVLAAQVQQTNLQPQIFDTSSALHSDLTTLLQTMGRPLGPGAAPEGSITLAEQWEDADLSFDPVAVAKESLARRPDLLALRETIRSYTEDANIARGGYYPLVRIYVTGEVLPEDFVQGQRNNAVRPEDNTQETQISPGIREDWNVIDTGQVRGDVRQRESIRDALVIALHHLEQDIPGELDLVRAQFASAARERDILQTNVSVSADTLNMIESGVAQGTNSQLEFLDAQTGAIFTRVGLIAAKLHMSIAHAEFDRVTGGYLRFVAEDQPAAPVSK